MLPEADCLPGAEQQTSVLHTQTEGLTGESGPNVRWHIVRPFIVMQVGPGLRNHVVHPGGEVLRTRGSAFSLMVRPALVCRQAQVQHSLDSTGGDPAAQDWIDPGKATTVRADVQRLQCLVA